MQVQPVLDDASDSSVNPRLVAAAPGAPNLLELFGMEDQDRAERAVDELEQIEVDVEGEEGDRVRNAVEAFPVYHLLQQRYVPDLKIDLIKICTTLFLYAVQPRGLPHFCPGRLLR